ncbi:Peptidase-M43 domain-containing protein [Fusarium keratoplasticum]|uniref:Peptidase-M43 domain-containing protein n=1 Tax=Fusarium keratoplasticum TaxID=1328300 RepID=A0ACC0QXT1_9HYPO|nr:Peptidase-M43 domain-containing protein [Fusarium keratoplasticum]KAI8670425.1 Peptidase-M43 domain-containing protein [Fusarium keratoplasticum]KAI8677660.1 Peptidase-M43 domain-containing protein [Fusarium keratoplasticum]
MVSKSILAVLLGTAGVLALPPRCAVTDPTPEQLDNAATLRAIEETARIAARASITVETYFHVVSSSSSKYITQKQLQDQLVYMNDSYGPHGVTFRLAGTDFTTNTNWAAGNGEVAMKRQLRKGDYSTLNLYFVDTPKLDGRTALGYCHFPEPGVTTGSTTFIKDGCVIDAQTVPGGTAEPYNLGGTAVHEIGHWFNLFHTFQGGCTGSGDFVSDTPAQGKNTSGCPARSDTCPNQPGDDPIHNYMDYSDDICYEEFTPGQETRLHTAWETYRQ